jgi:hypothetical protein
MICPGFAIVPPLNPQAVNQRLPNDPMRWIAVFSAPAKGDGAAAIEFGEVLEAIPADANGGKSGTSFQLSISRFGRGAIDGSWSQPNSW